MRKKISKYQVTSHETINEARDFDDRLGVFDSRNPLNELVYALEQGMIVRIFNEEALPYAN